MTPVTSHRQCEALVAALDLPAPFDLAVMCERIGARRGKPVVLMATPMAMGGGLCGLWMGTAKGDHVFYEQDTSPLHQQHIVFHELGHILRQHTPTRWRPPSSRQRASALWAATPTATRTSTRPN